jgi:hypothetical protein
VHIIRFFVGSAVLLSTPVYASCGTNVEGCSGTTLITNNFSQARCYVILWAGGNSTKNFCLQPGESDREQVRFGDYYCEAPNYTPNANTCSRYPFLVE